MATTFVSYTDIMSSTQTQVEADLVPHLVDRSPFLQIMKWGTINDVEYEWYEEGKLVSDAYRKYNAKYAENHVGTKKQTVRLKPHGDNFAIDRKLAKRKNFDRGSYVEQQAQSKVDAIGFGTKRMFASGDGQDSPMGVEVWTELVNDATTNPIITNFAEAANGKKISAATAREVRATFEKALMEHDGLPDYGFANGPVLAELAAASMADADLNGTFRWRVEEINGRKIRVLWFDEMFPIIDIGKDYDGSLIFTQDETIGSGSTGQSLYLVSFGKMGCLPLQDAVVEMFDYPSDPGTAWAVERADAFAYKMKNCVSRIQGMLKE